MIWNCSKEYASRGSEDAFATLVSRPIDMVYSVALRHVGNLHNAQEVTQAVFIILARKSRALRRETIISASRNKELASLRGQTLAQKATPAAEPALTDCQELEQLRADKMNLSNEVLKLREQVVSAKPRETKPPQPEVKLSRNAAQENRGRLPFIRVSEPTEEALDIYAELTGKTVLRPGKLHQLPVSIKADLPTDTNAAIARIVLELSR